MSANIKKNIEEIDFFKEKIHQLKSSTTNCMAIVQGLHKRGKTSQSTNSRQVFSHITGSDVSPLSQKTSINFTQCLKINEVSKQSKLKFLKKDAEQLIERIEELNKVNDALHKRQKDSCKNSHILQGNMQRHHSQSVTAHPYQNDYHQEDHLSKEFSIKQLPNPKHQGTHNIRSYIQNSYKGSQNKYNIILTNKKHVLKKRYLELMREKDLVMNEFLSYASHVTSPPEPVEAHQQSLLSTNIFASLNNITDAQSCAIGSPRNEDSLQQWDRQVYDTPYLQRKRISKFESTPSIAQPSKAILVKDQELPSTHSKYMSSQKVTSSGRIFREVLEKVNTHKDKQFLGSIRSGKMIVGRQKGGKCTSVRREGPVMFNTRQLSGQMINNFVNLGL